MIDWERVARVETHPLRLDILHRLAASTEARSPVELSKLLDKPIGDVGYHVRVLAESGLIHLVKTRPVRGAVEHFYAIGGER